MRVPFPLGLLALAQVTTALSTNPTQLFDNTWLPIILGVVQVASLVFLMVYVVKTVEIAQANRAAAEAAKDAAQATLASVRLSEQAVEEMRAARDAQTAPYVVVYLDMDVSGFIVRLVMENLGQTAAHDISLRFDPELDAALGLSQSEEWPRFMTGVTPTLAPKQRISTVLNSFAALVNNEAIKHPYTASVSYHGGMTEDAQQTERNARFVLDFMSFYGLMRISENDLEKAVGQLERLTKSVDSLREPLDSMKERFNRGIFTLRSVLTSANADHDVSVLSIVIDLVSGFRATWTLIEDRNRDRRQVADMDKQLAQRAIEQIVALVPFLQIQEGSRLRARSILAELTEKVRDHFRFGHDVEPQVLALLDELETLLRSEAGVPYHDSDTKSDAAEDAGSETDIPEAFPS